MKFSYLPVFIAQKATGNIKKNKTFGFLWECGCFSPSILFQVRVSKVNTHIGNFGYRNLVFVKSQISTNKSVKNSSKPTTLILGKGKVASIRK